MHLAALERAIQRIAGDRIESAMEQGEFDNLPGKGEPLPDLDEPYDANWWVRKWRRRQTLSEADLHRELRETTGNSEKRRD